MNSKNITDTNARVFQALSSVAQNVYDSQGVENKIDKAVTESMITTGYMTKFYPYLNKCEVKLDNNGKLVLCTLTSLFSGDLVFLYTPSGDESYCEKLRERCIIPRSRLNVLVAKINSDDYDYVMLGYFFPDDLVGFNPSAPSQFKIIAFDAINEYSIKFGLDGLKIVNNGEIELTSLDDYDGDVTVKYYNKTEIDDLVEELREEIHSGGGGISFDDVYPVGSIYMSVNSTNPSTLFGGTWVQLKDRFLLGCGDTYSNGSTGGSADAVVVSHTHDFSNGGQAITVASNSAIFTNGFGTGSHWNGSNANTGTVASSGESGTGKNMPPYLAVYMWKRTA